MNKSTNVFDNLVFDNQTPKLENDPYARVKAMATGALDASNVRFWSHEIDTPLVGTILGFDGFEHPRFGRQRTVIVEREGGEVVSAILTKYLEKGVDLKDAGIGDRVYIEKKGENCSRHGNLYNHFVFAVDKGSNY
jgi:hypothetical protein